MPALLRPPLSRRAVVAAAGLAAGLTFALALAAPVQAGEVAPTDAKRIQAVVRDQLGAFAADDAPRAYRHASPALQRQFGNAERFMAMVRITYPVVYRPASVAFLRPELTDGQWTQGVHLTDAQGARWLAVYVMQRDAAKRWRIAGCTLVPAPGPTAGPPPASPTSTARA